MESVKIPVVSKLHIVDGVLRFSRVRKKPGREYDIKVIANEPVSGVKVEGMVYVNHRCRVHRRLVKLIDPRGFEVYIMPDNLVEILNSTNVENGVIQGDCIYNYNGVLSYVYVVGSPEYNTMVKENASLLCFNTNKLQIGNVIEDKHHVSIWLGKHDLYAEVYELEYNGYKVYSWTINPMAIKYCFKDEGISGYEGIYNDVNDEIKVYCGAMQKYLTDGIESDYESARLRLNEYFSGHNYIRHKVLLGHYSCILHMIVIDNKVKYRLLAKKSISRRDFKRFIAGSETEYRKSLGLKVCKDLGLELFYKSDVLQPKLLNHGPYFDGDILYTSGLDSWGLSDYSNINQVTGTQIDNEEIEFTFDNGLYGDIRKAVKESILKNNGELRVFDTLPLEV